MTLFYVNLCFDIVKSKVFLMVLSSMRKINKDNQALIMVIVIR